MRENCCVFSVYVGQPPEEGGRGLGAGRRGGPATKGIKGMRICVLKLAEMRT